MIDRKAKVQDAFNKICQAIVSRNQWYEMQDATTADTCPEILETITEGIRRAGRDKCCAIEELEDALRITK